MIKRKGQLDIYSEFQACRSNFAYFCKHYVKYRHKPCSTCKYKKQCDNDSYYIVPDKTEDITYEQLACYAIWNRQSKKWDEVKQNE